MSFNEHYQKKGAHAFLSPSNPAWLNYDDEKLINRFYTAQEASRGTALHAYADMAITLKRKQPRNGETVNKYINDAIGYRMTPEQILFYSENCWGTCDAISFTKDILRIHDLKTGVTKSNMAQLRIYAALFCLEYEHDPRSLASILRIYQHDDIYEEEADPQEIFAIMQHIKHVDKIVEACREESLK